MTDIVRVALIAAVPGLLSTISTLVIYLLSRKKLNQIHIDLNGRLTQLLTATDIASRLKGKAEAQKEHAEVSAYHGPG